GLTSVTSTYAVWPRKAMSVAPPRPMIDFGRPDAYVVVAPVCGSTRVILPAAVSVTYSAPSGPTVLPQPPCRPVTRRDAVAVPDGAAAIAADGTLTAINAANNTNSLRAKRIRFSSPCGGHPCRAGTSRRRRGLAPRWPAPDRG